LLPPANVAPPRSLSDAPTGDMQQAQRGQERPHAGTERQHRRAVLHASGVLPGVLRRLGDPHTVLHTGGSFSIFHSQRSKLVSSHDGIDWIRLRSHRCKLHEFLPVSE